MCLSRSWLRKAYRLTSEESTAVLQGDVIVPPLPWAFADLADDEEDDCEGCAQQRRHHQELEAEDETLKHNDADHETQTARLATITTVAPGSETGDISMTIRLHACYSPQSWKSKLNLSPQVEQEEKWWLLTISKAEPRHGPCEGLGKSFSPTDTSLLSVKMGKWPHMDWIKHSVLSISQECKTQLTE